MDIFIDVGHDAVSMGEFSRLGVESARPTFNVIATIRYGDVEGVARCNVEGHYYCSGSCNFDIEDISCSQHPEPLEKLSSAAVELIWARLVEEIDTAVSGSVLAWCGDRIADCMFADLGRCDAVEEALDVEAPDEGGD